MMTRSDNYVLVFLPYRTNQIIILGTFPRSIAILVNIFGNNHLIRPLNRFEMRSSGSTKISVGYGVSILDYSCPQIRVRHHRIFPSNISLFFTTRLYIY